MFFLELQIAYWIHVFPELYFQKIKSEDQGPRIKYATLYLGFILGAYVFNYNRCWFEWIERILNQLSPFSVPDNFWLNLTFPFQGWTLSSCTALRCRGRIPRLPSSFLLWQAIVGHSTLPRARVPVCPRQVGSILHAVLFLWLFYVKTTEVLHNLATADRIRLIPLLRRVTEMRFNWHSMTRRPCIWIPM